MSLERIYRRRNITGRKPRKRDDKAKHRGIGNDQICVLVARERQKLTFSDVLGRGRILTTKLDEEIGSHLANSNVICTDSWREFSSYPNQKGLAHYLAWFRYLDSKEYETQRRIRRKC